MSVKKTKSTAKAKPSAKAKASAKGKTPAKAKSSVKAKAGKSAPALDAELHPLAKHFMWLDGPKLRSQFMWIVLGLLILVTAALFAFPNKHPKPWEPGVVQFISYGLIGAAAMAIIVLCAGAMRKMVVRKENYYGEEDSAGDDHV